MVMRYGVVLTPDDNDTVLVTAPDLPDATTFGEDREDALARAVDAIPLTAGIAIAEARNSLLEILNIAFLHNLPI